jgi:hypothetical protein
VYIYIYIYMHQKSKKMSEEKESILNLYFTKNYSARYTNCKNEQNKGTSSLPS